MPAEPRCQELSARDFSDPGLEFMICQGPWILGWKRSGEMSGWGIAGDPREYTWPGPTLTPGSACQLLQPLRDF